MDDKPKDAVPVLTKEMADHAEELIRTEWPSSYLDGEFKPMLEALRALASGKTVCIPSGAAPAEVERVIKWMNRAMCWLAMQASDAAAFRSEGDELIAELRRLSNPAPGREALQDALGRIESCVYAHGKHDETFKQIAAMRELLATPPPPAGSREAAGFTDVGTPDEMCPNCVTQNKCNGPHLQPESREPAPDDAELVTALRDDADWFDRWGEPPDGTAKLLRQAASRLAALTGKDKP